MHITVSNRGFLAPYHLLQYFTHVFSHSGFPPILSSKENLEWKPLKTGRSIMVFYMYWYMHLKSADKTIKLKLFLVNELLENKK